MSKVKSLDNSNFFEPEKQLNGFYIIALTYNNLSYLPNEDDLLKAFPDLQDETFFNLNIF